MNVPTVLHFIFPLHSDCFFVDSMMAKDDSSAETNQRERKAFLHFPSELLMNPIV